MNNKITFPLPDTFDHEYELQGKPVALKRPRYGSTKVYDSQKEQKLIDGLALKHQHGSTPLSNPLHLDVTFQFKIPKRLSPKLKKQLHNYYQSRPDIDNLLKYVLDTGNNVLWKDDALIASTLTRKIYANEEKTIIRIKEMI